MSRYNLSGQVDERLLAGRSQSGFQTPGSWNPVMPDSLIGHAVPPRPTTRRQGHQACNPRNEAPAPSIAVPRPSANSMFNFFVTGNGNSIQNFVGERSSSDALPPLAGAASTRERFFGNQFNGDSAGHVTPSGMVQQGNRHDVTGLTHHVDDAARATQQTSDDDNVSQRSTQSAPADLFKYRKYY